MFYYGPCDWLVCRFRFRLQQPSFHWNRKKWNVLILPTPIPSSLRLRLTTRMFYFRKVVSSLTTPTTIPTTTPSQVTTSFQRNILQHCCPHLATLSQRVATCWMLLTRVWKWSNISCRFVDVAWCCTRLVRFVEQCCTRYTSSIFNIQHVATLRKLLVWREPLFILRLCEQNSFVIVRLEILLWLYGPETFPGLSRNGPQGSNPDRSLQLNNSANVQKYRWITPLFFFLSLLADLAEWMELD